MAKTLRKKCQFCQSRALPDYKNLDQLRPFLTERGKILGRVKTGLCLRHQKKLAQALKRARHLALLPFVTRV